MIVVSLKGSEPNSRASLMLPTNAAVLVSWDSFSITKVEVPKLENSSLGPILTSAVKTESLPWLNLLALVLERMNEN